VVLSFALAPVFTLATDMLIGTAPPERAGAASGISETTAELGGALGIAVLGSVGAAIYRSQIAGEIPPSVPAGSALIARDTLGGAIEVAAQLPEPVRTALLDAAHRAFTDGFQTAAVVSAVLMLCAGLIAVFVLRDVKLDTDEPPGEEPEGLRPRPPRRRRRRR
jgi:DHA2 family multidrug resistance protein-like MFS transporter